MGGVAALGLVVVLAGCGVAAVSKPTADPTPVFLGQVKDIFPGDLTHAPEIAHGICDDYKAGTSFVDEVAYLRVLAPSMTAGQAGGLIGASTSSFCPEFNNRH